MTTALYNLSQTTGPLPPPPVYVEFPAGSNYYSSVSSEQTILYFNHVQSMTNFFMNVCNLTGNVNIDGSNGIMYIGCSCPNTVQISVTTPPLLMIPFQDTSLLHLRPFHSLQFQSTFDFYSMTEPNYPPVSIYDCAFCKPEETLVGWNGVSLDNINTIAIIYDTQTDLVTNIASVSINHAELTYFSNSLDEMITNQITPTIEQPQLVFRSTKRCTTSPLAIGVQFQAIACTPGTIQLDNVYLYNPGCTGTSSCVTNTTSLPTIGPGLLTITGISGVTGTSSPCCTCPEYVACTSFDLSSAQTLSYSADGCDISFTSSSAVSISGVYCEGENENYVIVSQYIVMSITKNGDTVDYFTFSNCYPSSQ